MDINMVRVSAITQFRGDTRWLSNFHLIPIEYEGIVYPSTEHAYQAAKTLDLDIRNGLLKLTCAKVKIAGMSVPLRPDWEEIKLSIMKEVNRIKFKDPTLRQMLLDTGDADLIEGNTWGDVFWGVCDGKGKNHLGRILMEIREEIRNEIDFEKDFFVRLGIIVGEGF